MEEGEEESVSGNGIRVWKKLKGEGTRRKKMNEVVGEKWKSE